MSQTILNDHQAHWLIQLTLYDFTIQYHQDTLNPADESSQRSDYMMMKQSERCYKSTEKSHKLSLKQFWSTSRCVDSSLISKLTFWWVSDLISTLINKLATAVLRAGGQYSCNIRETDLKAESLIQILSLQVMTWSKVRLTADNLVSYSKTSSLSQRTMSSDIFISKKNLSILSLIKDV